METKTKSNVVEVRREGVRPNPGLGRLCLQCEHRSPFQGLAGVLPSFPCLAIEYRPAAYKPQEWIDLKGCLRIAKIPNLVRWDDGIEDCPKFKGNGARKAG
jgi:hypothetical protein